MATSEASGARTITRTAWALLLSRAVLYFTLCRNLLLYSTGFCPLPTLPAPTANPAQLWIPDGQKNNVLADQLQFQHHHDHDPARRRPRPYRSAFPNPNPFRPLTHPPLHSFQNVVASLG